jgi:hypothetical protein
VIEITLVGTNAETSPAWVSMIGRAVSEPVLPLTSPLVNFSTYSSKRGRRAPADGSGDRTRRPGRLHGLADGAAAGNLTVGHGLLGQIVINDQGVTAVAEVLAHGATGVRRQVLHAADSEAGSHDDGVFHRAVLFQLANHVGNGRSLLTDRNVDAENAAGLSG